MKLIRTKDGRIIDVEKFIKEEKENLNYSDFSDFRLKNKGDHCVIEWSAIGTKNNSIVDQIGRRCQFGASINSPFVAKSNSLLKLGDYLIRKPVGSVDDRPYILEKIIHKGYLDHNNYAKVKQVLKEQYKLHKMGDKAIIYLAIETNKGITYVAQMNDNGELELL